MQYRHLGRSGLKVSEISLGGWLNLGDWVDERNAIALIHQAFAAGVNLFDVADVYAEGRAEVVLGKALKELPREQAVVATKCRWCMWPGPLGEGLSKKHIIEACHASLKRLDIDYIDLYQVHSPDPDTPIEETMAALDLLVRQGKVLYLGCSNFTADRLRKAQSAADSQRGTRFISNQPQYSMLWREPEKELFPACLELGVGNIVYSPLAQGVLTGKYQRGVIPEGSRQSYSEHDIPFINEENLATVDRLNSLAEQLGMTVAQLALRWCLRREEVASAIVGATRPEQLDETLRAGSMTLGQDQTKAIDEVLDQQGQ
ncbi:MAG: aldo/keto reductase family protein [Fidelibacterota bacterium]|nr:MAG: aldo/keto reductase family protein [Candidatus Neomarinimicrobiota bacterium]